MGSRRGGKHSRPHRWSTPALGAAAAAASQLGAAPRAHILPTIRLVSGQLPRAVEETERAVLAAGTAIFSRTGVLVYPIAETMTAAAGRKTVMARLSAFSADSFLERGRGRHIPAL